MADDRMEQWKARIGLAPSYPGDQPGRGIVATWPAPTTWQSLRDAPWRVVTDSVTAATPGVGRREWALVHEKARLLVRLGVSSVGNALSRDQVLAHATTTMRRDIPFEAPAQRLGDLAIVLPNAGPRASFVAWAYRNVYVELSGENMPDVIGLARELQAFLQEQPIVALEPHLPHLDRLRVTPARLPAGETADVLLVAPRLVPPERYVVAFRTDPGLVVERFDELQATVRAADAGVATVTVTAVDRETLLARSLGEPVTVDATPAP